MINGTYPHKRTVLRPACPIRAWGNEDKWAVPSQQRPAAAGKRPPCGGWQATPGGGRRPACGLAAGDGRAGAPSAGGFEDDDGDLPGGLPLVVREPRVGGLLGGPDPLALVAFSDPGQQFHRPGADLGALDRPRAPGPAWRRPAGRRPGPQVSTSTTGPTPGVRDGSPHSSASLRAASRWPACRWRVLAR